MATQELKFTIDLDKLWRRQVALLFHRYKDMAKDEELKSFCLKAIQEIQEHPSLKLSRWLGYVQGRLIAEGVTTIEIERDETRPILKELELRMHKWERADN